MANILQSVQTYQDSALAYLQNYSCFISTANTKFKNFDKLEAQLGSTVGFDLPTRYTTTNSLVANFQGTEQRVHTLTIDKAENVAINFSAQEFILQARDYMERFGKGAIEELATSVESDVALNCETGPYRFYGDAAAGLNTYLELAEALSLFRNFGAVQTDTKGYIDDTVVPAIINSGLAQFAPDRANKDAMSWELGNFSRSTWYQSNLLPVHTAGSEGINSTTLTVVSTGLDANGAVTSIVFSGANAASDADSVKLYDRFSFDDSVAGQANIRFLTFVGHKKSKNAVQFRATADAASTAGQEVTVSLYPPLQAAAGRDQNISRTIVAGMQCSVLPTHRVGMITSGNPLFLGMPRLPEEVPFPTANKTDPDTGVSMRMYYGSLFGQDQRGMIHDCIWGSTVVPEYSMALIFPE